jgi:TonB family protein
MTQVLVKEPASESLPPAPVLLIEAAPWRRNFLQNFCDLLWPERVPSLHLSSPPGEFWPDVFVASKLPWHKVPLSALLHVSVVAAMLTVTRIWPQPVQVATPATFDSHDVISFSPEEELPPLDTGGQPIQTAQHGNPAYSAQSIMSVPPEAQSRKQTIVAPPEVKLAQDVPAANVIAWKQAPPSVPIAATENMQPRKNPALAFAAIAPAPELTQMASQHATLSQPSAVAPQPQLQANLSHRLDAINIGHQKVVAPAPQLPVAESHTAPRMGLDAVQAAAPQPTVNLESRRSRMVLPQSAAVAPAPNFQASGERRAEHSLSQEQVIAPAPNVAHLDVHAKRPIALGEPSRVVPPAPSAVSLTAQASDRQIIALNLHPAAVAPPEANRRGTFASTPQGKKDAIGTPEIANTASQHETSSTNKMNTLPPGLRVGVPENKAQQSNAGSGNHASGTSGPAEASDHPLMASVNVPRVSPGRPAHEVPEESASEDDRKIFGGRKFYSMAMNFANLNSGGGSWIFHFAELKDSQKGTLMAPEVERQVDPAYPTELMRQNVHGTVVLSALIGSDGSVNDVRVLESVDDRLDEFAREALNKWHFRPATKNGNPVALTMIVKVPFRPSRGLF